MNSILKLFKKREYVWPLKQNCCKIQEVHNNINILSDGRYNVTLYRIRISISNGDKIKDCLKMVYYYE